MHYILNIPGPYKGPFSLLVDGQKYSLPQSPDSVPYPDEDWAKIKDTEEIKALRNAKALHIMEAGESPKPDAASTAAPTSTAPTDLSDVKGEDLDKTIDEQSDIATLEKWLSSEQRITVKRKLNERIAELKS